MSQLLQVAIRSGAGSADGTTAPDSFSQGIPFAAGAIAIDGTSAIASYSQGLPLTAAGRIATTTDAPASWVSGSMPINAAGRLCMLSGAVDSYVTGIPFTATGQVAVASSAESRFTLNGTTQWITFSPWIPTTNQYVMSCYFREEGAGGTSPVNLVVGANNTGAPRIYVNTGTDNVFYRTLSDVDANIFIDSLINSQPTRTLFAEAVSFATNSTFQVTDGGVGTNNQTPKLPIVGVDRIGGSATNTAFSGPVFDVKLLDTADPSNSRWYKINDGAGDTIKCYEENGDLKPDNTLDGTIAGFVDDSAWS